jgi:hypothetical protein
MVTLKGGTRLVHPGCSEDPDFEIDSITKDVTGLLYFDGAGGQVRPATFVGELPSVTGSTGEIRLATLATHRSGLPRTVAGHVLRRSLDYLRRCKDPFAQPLPSCSRTP